MQTIERFFIRGVDEFGVVWHDKDPDGDYCNAEQVIAEIERLNTIIASKDAEIERLNQQNKKLMEIICDEHSVSPEIVNEWIGQ